MLRGTAAARHRSGHSRPFVLHDPSLKLLRAGSGFHQLKRMGVAGARHGLGFAKVDGRYANAPYQHAWPLLSHDDFGNSDQSNDTHNIMYSMYMPKRNKGTAPWFRGADTYSVKYSEQGRYEYQRYLMINRFPSEYKRHFATFLNNIRAARASYALPQEALHWLLRMIVDNFNPQHVHYIAAMKTLQEAGELDMARDVWKIMERQQTWPDTSTICAYLDVCVAARERAWAAEAYNRYCTELTFLQHGDVDPQPITRVPFSLTRDELLYLPKWKKHFDHDPNLDVVDLNRFNRTREVYVRMAKVSLACGDAELYRHFYGKLQQAMLQTPTPVPEPPNPHMVPRPRWTPYEHAPSLHASPWRMDNNGRALALGPRVTVEDEMQSRFFSNAQFVVHAAKEMLAVLLDTHRHRHASACARDDYACGLTPRSPDATTTTTTSDGSNDTMPFLRRVASDDVDATLRQCDEIVDGVFAVLQDKLCSLRTSSLLTHLLAIYRVVGKETGAQLHARAEAFLQRKAALQAAHDHNNDKHNNDSDKDNASAKHAPGVDVEALQSSNYLEILTGFADESAFYFDRAHNTCTYRDGFDARATMTALLRVLREIAANPHVTWAADMHLQVVRTLVNCGTMQANAYFVANVLRQYKWDSAFLEALYMEYRRHDDVDTWAELTKRALVWTARYDVTASEALRRRIEDDYDLIAVQTRTFRELAVFHFRDAEEKRHARNVVNELPNPWIDYVSHALPFPDRDAGYPDEYGDIGQWRAPGGPGSPVKGPGYYAPPLEGENLHGYTAEWRDLKNPMRPPPFPLPWERKYKQYARGQHPSYDMVYAGPMPEIFPARHNFRKPTRWDYQDIHMQSKYKISGPY